MAIREGLRRVRWAAVGGLPSRQAATNNPSIGPAQSPGGKQAQAYIAIASAPEGLNLTASPATGRRTDASPPPLRPGEVAEILLEAVPIHTKGLGI